MKIQKKTSMGGDWAKAGETIKDGDRIKILNAGEMVAGDFGDRHVFKIMTRDKKEYNLSFNQTSLNNMVEAFGDESDDWAGKIVNIVVVKVMVSGKMRNVAYIAPDGFTMNDDGSFSNTIQTAPTPPAKRPYPTMTEKNNAQFDETMDEVLSPEGDGARGRVEEDFE